jgi:hypothetical protein
MISAVPQPSAVARMIRDRHTCFCGLLRSATRRVTIAKNASYWDDGLPDPEAGADLIAMISCMQNPKGFYQGDTRKLRRYDWHPSRLGDKAAKPSIWLHK